MLGITIAEAFSRYVVHTIEMEYKLKMTDQDMNESEKTEYEKGLLF